MLDYANPARGVAFERAVVTVVFLRLNKCPARPRTPLPPGATLRAERLNRAEYRALYDEVGAPWMWWLRRVMPDALLSRHLANSNVAVHLLRLDGEVAGFFETDTSPWPDVNLNYFGLKPAYIGRGLGRILLDAAVDSVFLGASGLRGMTLNTCSADHPRALPNYLAAGFKETRRVREVWDIPCRLGLKVPPYLRG
jgi:GNAT superfamily N-acetyltransferase